MLDPPPQVSRGTRSRSSGFTLVEALLAIVVLIIAMLGAIGTIAQVTRLGESNRESTVAYQAARSQMEALHSSTFELVFARYNQDPTDDPGGEGTADGMHFVVDGLRAREDDPDGVAGRILLPISPEGELREDLDAPEFGLPRDLTGDGVIDDEDHSTDCILLPIRVQVAWTGKSGDRTVEFSTSLGMRR